MQGSSGMEEGQGNFHYKVKAYELVWLTISLSFRPMCVSESMCVFVPAFVRCTCSH